MELCVSCGQAEVAARGENCAKCLAKMRHSDLSYAVQWAAKHGCRVVNGDGQEVTLESLKAQKG